MLVAALALPLAGCSISYSDGYRVGHVQKLSTKGFVFKVVEGEMATEGIKAQQIDGRISSVWTFNVLDAEVQKQLVDAADKRVKIHYKEWIYPNPFTMSTAYEATKIEIYQGN